MDKLYRHDDLLSLVDERITIRVPILDAGGRIPVLDDKGQVICVAGVVERFRLRDIQGAKEQGPQNKALNAQIAAAGAGAEKLDIPAEIARAVAQMPAPPVPQQLATISVHPALRQAALEAEAVHAPEADPAPSKLMRLGAWAAAGNLRRAG